MGWVHLFCFVSILLQIKNNKVIKHNENVKRFVVCRGRTINQIIDQLEVQITLNNTSLSTYNVQQSGVTVFIYELFRKNFF